MIVVSRNDEQSAAPCLVGNALPVIISVISRAACIRQKPTDNSSKTVVLIASYRSCYIELSEVKYHHDREAHCNFYKNEKRLIEVKL